MIFAPDNAPASVAATLNDISDAAAGRPIPQILELVSSRLESTDRDGDQQMLDSQEFDDFDEDDEYEEEYFPGDEDMLPRPLSDGRSGTVPASGFTEATTAFKHRIRRDLLAAKHSGFKVGHLGSLMDGMGCYVSVSIRIAKLGISEEAMQAWQLEPAEYLVAIFHYPAGYKSMDDLKSYDTAQARRNFGIRIGISTSYKPTMQEAIQAFTVLSKDEEKRREASQATESQQQTMLPKGFRNSFISRPLNELFEQRLHMLLKYRYSGMPWSGAEAFYNDQILRPSHTTHAAGSEDRYYEPEQVSTLYPSLVTADHIQDSTSPEHSMPLVGMQFLLRHFVRCTEFCLICFSKMPDDLQAIKPYVCDNPLCLYQYMSLGFGPSIEHEILSQPKVVDLLISFCYASARLGRLRDFPSGLSLAVPPPASNEVYALSDSQYYNRYVAPAPNPPPQQSVAAQTQTAIKARYNAATNELLFEDKNLPCPIGNANWIVLRTDDAPDKAMHCRIIDTSLYPSVRLTDPIIPMAPDLQQPNYPGTSRPGLSNPLHPAAKAAQAAASLSNEFRAASFYIYEQNFDDLSDVQKRQAISALLDLLPQVEEMKKYLVRKAQSPLNTWVDRLSPALLGLLRWIIASNRACIVQVDEEDDVQTGRKTEDRLYGMPGWAQFRFAMGAPDKERRFIQAVRATSERLRLKYPTLFAWHGSPMQNWHSIIREGLHFNDTLHGRAFGNGVYHALDVGTSLGYSQALAGMTWPNSDLKIQQALALNEIVNAPMEFTSSSPHLVVAQLDWIQTRYLFVKTRQDYAVTAPTDKGTKPHDFLQQDPTMTPRGTSEALVIPTHAISGSRRPKPKTTSVCYLTPYLDVRTDHSQKNKRMKATSGSQYDPIEIDDDDDAASIATLEEDRTIFEDDDLNQHQQESLPTPTSVTGDKGKSKIGGFVSKMFGSKAPAKPLTDYIPGTLDYSTLPMLQMPAWATTGATKRLMKDFKDLITVQNTTPPHELGWHIDEDKVDNIYQWIVEMHSFDPTLPLAQDMKKKDVKSIVLELRFGKDYPMSPPFVRVIRPRFLGFMQGGGGHVTAGGAMCMQLLTNDGWSAVSSIESVLLQVRMAMSSLEPKPARLEGGGRSDYGVGEAVEAYIRACNVHGWTVPSGFRELAYGGSQGGDLYNSF
jgi:ubiquitin-conjugating enzyme E2 Q